MRPDGYLVWGTVLTADGTEVVLDLERPGYEAFFVAGVQRVALVPKDGVDFAPLVVNVPRGAVPRFVSRVKGSIGLDDGAERRVRIYGLGYAQGQRQYIAWLLPNGTVEVGPDSLFADLLLAVGPGVN